MNRRARPSARRERGSAVPLMALVLAVTAVCTVGAARMGDATVRRARVDAAADLTALATATGGPVTGARVATIAATELVEVRHHPGGVVAITVEQDGLSGTAAAALTDTVTDVTGGGHVGG